MGKFVLALGPATTVHVGDKVRYSVQWLRSTGNYAGDIPHAKGVVTAIEPISGTSYLAVVDWGNPDIPSKVLSNNLTVIGSPKERYEQMASAKVALDKKLEWERIYEGLKDILDILTGMDEKPVMQSELYRLIETAKIQAKLWTNPPVKTLASGDDMEDLKKRAEAIKARAKYHVAKHKNAESPAMGVYETGLKRYPEFKPLVDKVVRATLTAINAEASKVQSEMPYKAQFTLEEIIRELQERV